MPATYLLTEADRNVLKGLLDRERARNPGLRGFSTVEEDAQAPEVYVARTPAGGIPVLTEEAGAGIVDQPGYADCNIYKVVLESDLPKLRPIAGLSKRVHNLTTTAIAANSWISVIRDKLGTWLAQVSGGGGEDTDRVVRVTNTTPNAAGYLTGFVQNYDTSTNTFSDGDACWVRNVAP